MSPTTVTPVAPRQPFLQHAHLRAIAFDRQFGDASLALGLDQRLRARRCASHRAGVSGIDVSIGSRSRRRCRRRSPECGRSCRAKNVFTYTAPSARIAMPSTPASCGSAGTHTSSAVAPGLQAMDAIGERLGRVDRAVGRDGHVVAHAAIARERIRALGGAALQVEGSQRGLPDHGRAAAAAGVVLADPQRVGLVVREHAEHVGQAGGRGLNPGFGLRAPGAAR